MSLTAPLKSPLSRIRTSRPFSSCALLLQKKRNSSKYSFYDYVRATPSNPVQPLEASLMSQKDLDTLKERTHATFEGNYSIDTSSTPEERIKKIFGNRIKDDTRESSSRVNRGKPRTIEGIIVPARPPEPDNCCMSGCINCVWELYNDDIKDWNKKRAQAAEKLAKTDKIWPEDFDPPVRALPKKNLPKSFAARADEVKEEKTDDTWGNVPVTIKVFAEMEKKIKNRRKAEKS